MKKLALAVIALAAATGCAKDLEQTTPPKQVVARFDPSVNPPVVPAPTDLAVDPTTGKLKIPTPANASGADLEFISYLETLDGFPPDTPGQLTFNGKLDPASVTADTVKVFELPASGAVTLTPVTGAATAYASTKDTHAPGNLTVAPPAGGWKKGTTYAVVLVGGDAGLKGEKGEPVVGSPAWALVRSKNSLVTCTDLTSADCQATSALIPANATDPAARLAEQARNAVALEKVRLSYKPLFDALDAAGIPRERIPLLTRFKITSQVSLAFDPTSPLCPPPVPAPNDLAIDPTTGLVNAPVCPDYPDAQKEFTTDYLNHLDGFPPAAEATAPVAGGDLKGSSVTSQSVVVADLSDPTTPPAPQLVTYDPARHAIAIEPPVGGWKKGHQYAAAVLIGQGGVTDPAGAPAITGDVFALIRSSEPLVDCEDLTSADCHSTVTVAPVSDEQAVQLEGLRQKYAPLFDALGLDRADVGMLWTFSITGQAEVRFNLAPPNPDGGPSGAILPFPNALLFDADGGHVSLPNPGGNPLIAGLNTLDGFSTTAAVIPTNDEALDGIDTLSDGVKVDPASLAGPVAGLINLRGTEQPKVKLCVSCTASTYEDGGTPAGPDLLELVPEVPLLERSDYAGYVTTAVKGDNAKAVAPTTQFALLRMKNPLVDASGKSQVSGLPDAQAAQLEPLRQAFKPLMDGLEAGGLARASLALAWPFHTQTTQSALYALAGYPASLPAAAFPTTPDYAVPVDQLLATLPVPHDHIAHLVTGAYRSAFALTGPGGTLNPTGPIPGKVPFVVTIPTGTMPAGGWPTVIFGHGLGRHRLDALAIANTFATAGFATIATDTVWHGERSICAGSSLFTGFPDDAACADPTAQKCDENQASVTFGRCIARDATTRADCTNPPGGFPGDIYCNAINQGACAADGKCQGGDFARSSDLKPLISGWNILNLGNLFATRDNFRQQVIDLSQLVRVMADATAGGLNARLTAGAGAKLDATQLHYTGQSLGGILGTLFTSANPAVEHVVLNVPGGHLDEIILTAPAFADVRAQYLAGLQAQAGLTPGTSGFDAYLRISDWILDPADPWNAAYYLDQGPGAGPGRGVLVQYIEGDQVVPNPTTLKLIGSANRDAAAPQVEVHEFMPSDTPGDALYLAPENRHGFLLSPNNPTLTGQAQLEAATFVATGATH